MFIVCASYGRHELLLARLEEFTGDRKGSLIVNEDYTFPFYTLEIIHLLTCVAFVSKNKIKEIFLKFIL